jgi:exopolysaccharide biosynthesis polyprenyl glycosylphosphotransferase
LAQSNGVTPDSAATGSYMAETPTRFRLHVSRWRFVACVQVLHFITFVIIGSFWAGALTATSLHRGWLFAVAVGLPVAIMIWCVFEVFGVYDFAILVNGRKAAFRAACATMLSCGPLVMPLVIAGGMGDPHVQLPEGLIAAELLLLPAFHFFMSTFCATLQRIGMVKRRIYIIVDGEIAARSLTAQLERVSENRVTGVWDMAGRSGSPALAGAVDYLCEHPVDAVVVRLPLSQPERLMETVRILRRLPREVLLAPPIENVDGLVRRTDIVRIGRSEWPSDMAMIKLSDRPLAGWRWVMKDVSDRVLAAALLVLVSPVMIAVAIGIKLADPGPVFFRQKRRGYGGDTFDIYKFRSMRSAPTGGDGPSLRLTTRDDPRIFPLGRFLRKTSLDELPQLLNVLSGDMWLIGPRPHSPYAQAGGKIYAEAVEDYTARYRIKPGITGWAQVSGWRGPTETLEQLSQRVEHDLYYVENWSLLFDFKILCKTLLCAVGHDNAF